MRHAIHKTTMVVWNVTSRETSMSFQNPREKIQKLPIKISLLAALLLSVFFRRLQFTRIVCCIWHISRAWQNYWSSGNSPLTTTAMSTKSISPRASTLASHRYTPSSALVTWWICRLLFASTWNLPSRTVGKIDKDRKRERREETTKEQQCMIERGVR